MDASSRLEELMRLSFVEIGDLPESSSLEAVDGDGKKCQIVTWREQIGPEVHRVVVSQHKLHGLGFSSLCSARGFTINAKGRLEMLDPKDAEQLLL